MSPPDEARFLATRVRDLDLSQIREWYSATVYDDHLAATMRWLTPRILELLLDEHEIAIVGNEVAFRRLARSGFPGSYDDRQVKAMTEACHELLGRQIHAPTLSGLDEALCMIAGSGLRLKPFFAQIDALPDDELVEVLHGNWVYNGNAWIARTAFWDGLDGKAESWAWYRSPELLERIERQEALLQPKAITVASGRVH
jgi:hypothetical protein